MESKLKSDLELFNLMVEFLMNEETVNPVSKRIEAEKLYETLDLSLQDDPMVREDYIKTLKNLIFATPKTGTNLFFNQLFGGRQGKAILGDLLAVILNNSMYTYKVAGPQVGIEQEIIRKSCDLIGYGKKSNGTFPTGGSMSNYMALVMARDKYDLSIRNNGITERLVIYTSIESHYSNAKNASFVGIGRSNVRYIDADENGCMIPSVLEDRIKEDINNGYTPIYVNATAGTTVLGAFDPVNKIADVCEKYNLWLHVDGAYCGGVIFSRKYRHLVDGVKRADSFSFNAHKMLGTPLTCSVLLVKNKENLSNSFNNDAKYLYQTDKDDFNLGKTSFQCGRRNDALKFWTLWKSIGTNGLEKMVNHQFYLADEARTYINNNSDYELYSFNNSISVCFNYKGLDAKKICRALYENHKALVGFGSFSDNEFIRFVTINSNNSRDDILNFFKVLEDFVEKNPDLIQ